MPSILYCRHGHSHYASSFDEFKGLLNTDHRPKPTDHASTCRLPLPTATIAIYYYYSALVLPSYTEDGTVNLPRQCSKGAQPVPMAVSLQTKTLSGIITRGSYQ